MKVSRPVPRTLVFCLLLICWLSLALPLAAREMKYVVYLKHPEAIGAPIPFVEVLKLRINGDKEIVASGSSTLTRKQHKQGRKFHFDDLSSLEWSERSGQLTLNFFSGGRGDFYCYPKDVSLPSDDATLPASGMENVMVEGEFLIVGRKVKQRVRLGDIHKIFFADVNAPLDAVVFQWAEGQNSFEAWQKFLAVFPGSTRVTAAKEKLAEIHLRASEESWSQFKDGGPLWTAESARKHAEQALELRPGYARAAEFRDRAIDGERNLRARVEQLSQLVAAQKWDEALAVHAEIKHYESEITQIRQQAEAARRGGSEMHRGAARSHLEAGRLDEAIAEFTAAQRILATEDLRAELREALIRRTLRDAGALHAAQDWPKAHELLERARSEFGDDLRLDKLRLAVREKWADRLQASARPMLLPAARIDSAAAEEKHRRALGDLEQASRLVARPEVEKGVATLRRRLALWYAGLGEKKLAALRGAHVGQAYLMLLRAESYDSEIPNLAMALDRARESFRAKTSTGVNVVFTDRTVRKAAGDVAGTLENFVGTEITNAQLPNVFVVERAEFEKLTSEQALTEMHSERATPLNLQSARVQVLGDILLCEARQRQNTTYPTSQYVSGYRDNPEWFRLSNLRTDYANRAAYLDEQQRSYEACAENERRIEHQTGRSTKVPGSCRMTQDQLRQQLSAVRYELSNIEGVLSRTPQNFAIVSPYRYTRRDVSVEGRIKVGFRIVDSLSSVRREQEFVTAEDGAKDYEISGAQPQDTARVADRMASVASEEEIVERLVSNAQRKIAAAAVNFLRSLPEKYFERARIARERGAADDAVENYILFLATSKQKGGPQRTEAENYLLETRNLVYKPDM